MAPKRTLDLPVAENESITVELDPLPPPDDLQVFIEALVDERPPSRYWTRLASQCWIEDRNQEAQLICQRGVEVLSPSKPIEALPLFALLSAFANSNACHAPKQILHDAKYQNLSHQQPKDSFYRETLAHFNRSQSIDAAHHLNQLTRAIHSTNTGDNHVALRIYENILAKQPRHAIALLGKACILLRKRQYAPALKLYQQVLEISLLIQSQADKHPDAATHLGWRGPDPRVGIGLCLWGLGHHEAARKAWKRSVALNPNHSPAHLLLGISSLNAAKQSCKLLPGTFGAHVERSEPEARGLAYTEGMASLQQSWKLEKRNAMAAIAMCQHFIDKASEASKLALQDDAEQTAMGFYSPALKLAEHAIQYADSRAAVVQAWLCYAHASHLASHLSINSAQPELRLQAQRYYTRVIDDFSRQSANTASSAAQLPAGLGLAVLGLAQCQVANRDYLAAINTLDSITNKPASATFASQTIELSLLAASLRAQSHPGASPLERLADSEKARIMLDRALRLIEAVKVELYGQGIMQAESEEWQATHGVNGHIAASSAEVGGAVAKALATLRTEELSRNTLEAISDLGNDPMAQVEFAELLQTEDLVRATNAYADALRIAQKKAELLPSTDATSSALMASLQNNLSAVMAIRAFDLQAEVESNRNEERDWLLNKSISRLESAIAGAASAALQGAKPEVQQTIDAVKVLASYNLGRVNEVAGNLEGARQAYQALLGAHSEYVDAKVRMAILTVSGTVKPGEEGASEMRRMRDSANSLFKEALAADASNLDTRASYVCFLAGEMAGNPTPAWGAIKDFTAQLFAGPDAGKAVFGGASAAKAAADEGRKDAHTLSSLGWTYYQLAIHVHPGPHAKAERAKGMMRAVDLMEKALASDPRCAFAAQGMAILYAEDAFGEISAGNSTVALEERRHKNADKAIAILSKLREARDHASVHVCMGHALMIKDEFERAFKSYELASRRFCQDSNASVLQYMARAEFALGMKTKSFHNLQHSLECLDMARELTVKEKGSNHADWKQISYNMAVTAHKSLQMLFDLSKEKRTSEGIRQAISAVERFQPLLTDGEGGNGELIDAAKKGLLIYISAEVVEQRGKYGSGLLRQAPLMLTEQDSYEDTLRQQREAVLTARREKELFKEQERLKREEQYRIEAEVISERRRQAKQEAAKIEYIREVTPEKESRRSKKRQDVGWGGEGGGEEDTNDSETRRTKRKGGKRKRKENNNTNLDAADESEEEDDDEDDDEKLFGGGDDSGSEEGGSRSEKESEDGDAEIIRNGITMLEGEQDKNNENRSRKKPKKQTKKKNNNKDESVKKKKRKLVKRTVQEEDDEEEEDRDTRDMFAESSGDEAAAAEEEMAKKSKRTKKVKVHMNEEIDSDEEMLLD